MKTGYQKLNNNRYYFDPETGKAMTGFITVTFSDGDFLFYFAGEKGTLSGLQKIDGGTYYLSSMGEVQTGFQIINGGKYYFDEETGKAQYVDYLPEKTEEDVLISEIKDFYLDCDAQ